MKKLFIILLISLFAFKGYSQEKKEITEQDYTNSDVEMADKFRSEGKIYVLTGIILVILFGTITYLIVIDRKVSKLEKELGNTSD